MSKVTIAVTAGVAAVYPFGQQHASRVLKQGQSLDVEVGPDAGPKLADLAGVLGLVFDSIKADLGAPAAGVAQDEPFGQRDGTMEVRAADGPVTVRRYAGSDFAELSLAEGEKFTAEVTESNRITLAIYPAEASPK
jgi:ferric-dicitrate binding protein FerR (iron transport regulator)